jgi:hypothetical protein
VAGLPPRLPSDAFLHHAKGRDRTDSAWGGDGKRMALRRPKASRPSMAPLLHRSLRSAHGTLLAWQPRLQSPHRGCHRCRAFVAGFRPVNPMLASRGRGQGRRGHLMSLFSTALSRGTLRRCILPAAARRHVLSSEAPSAKGSVRVVPLDVAAGSLWTLAGKQDLRRPETSSTCWCLGRILPR